MDIFLTILMTFFAATGAYLVTSTAALYSEKSGTVNIAIEGTMVMGLFVYASIIYFGAGTMGVFWLQLIAILGAIVTGILWTMLLAVPTINFMSDHIITGTALNILAPALSMLIMQQAMSIDKIDPSGVAAFGATTGGFTWIYLGFFILALGIVSIGWYVLNKTRFGLRIRAAGENPHALESSGVSVIKTRYLGLIIAGALAGLGGSMAFFIIHNTFLGAVNGMGYIAIAILIAGNWTTKGNIIWSFIFGAIIAVTNSYASMFIGSTPIIPQEFISMIPFIIPVVALVFMKESKVPSAEGIPYNKETH